MGHPERVSLDMSVEEACVMHTGLEYFKMYLESHPELVALSADLPAVEKLSKEVQTQIKKIQQQTAQSPWRGSGRPAW